MTIEERIEQLERNNRRLLAGLLAVTLLGIGVAATPKPGGDVVAEVRARCFTLVDDNGQARAVLGVAKNGPRLDLYDENGNQRAALSVFKKSGTGLVLFDVNGKTRVWLVMNKDGPRLDLYDEDENPIWKAP